MPLPTPANPTTTINQRTLNRMRGSLMDGPHIPDPPDARRSPDVPILRPHCSPCHPPTVAVKWPDEPRVDRTFAMPEVPRRSRTRRRAAGASVPGVRGGVPGREGSAEARGGTLRRELWEAVEPL